MSDLTFEQPDSLMIAVKQAAQHESEKFRYGDEVRVLMTAGLSHEGEHCLDFCPSVVRFLRKIKRGWWLRRNKDMNQAVFILNGPEVADKVPSEAGILVFEANISLQYHGISLELLPETFRHYPVARHEVADLENHWGRRISERVLSHVA
jgi:hypothetical protein